MSQDITNAVVNLGREDGGRQQLDEILRGLLSSSSGAVGPKIAAFGDSITANGYSVSGNAVAHNTQGYITWLNVLTRQRFYHTGSLNFGLSGDTLAGMVTRLPAVLAARPDICIVLGGTNGLTTSTETTDDQIGQLRTIYDALAAIGCTVIAIPILARSGAKATTSDGQLRAHAINHWIRMQAGIRRNFYVADCGVVYDDPTSSVWAERSGYSADNLHPNAVGAYAIALKIKAILDTLYPDWRAPVANITDLYDAVKNPRGNLLPNGAFAGGTTTATSWSLATGSVLGATSAASKTTLSDGRIAQRLTMSGTYTGTNGGIYFQSSVTASNINPGDEVEAFVEFSAGNLTNISQVYVNMVSVEGGTTYQNQGLFGSASLAWPSGAVNGVIRVPSKVFTQTPTSLNLRVGLNFITPGSATTINGQIDFAAAVVRKIL